MKSQENKLFPVDVISSFKLVIGQINETFSQGLDGCSFMVNSSIHTMIGWWYGFSLFGSKMYQ